MRLVDKTCDKLARIEKVAIVMLTSVIAFLTEHIVQSVIANQKAQEFASIANTFAQASQKCFDENFPRQAYSDYKMFLRLKIWIPRKYVGNSGFLSEYGPIVVDSHSKDAVSVAFYGMPNKLQSKLAEKLSKDGINIIAKSTDEDCPENVGSGCEFKSAMLQILIPGN